MLDAVQCGVETFRSVYVHVGRFKGLDLNPRRCFCGNGYLARLLSFWHCSFKAGKPEASRRTKGLAPRCPAACENPSRFQQYSFARKL